MTVENNTSSEDRQGGFVIESHGLRYAGVHLLVELWGGERLDDLQNVEVALREAMASCGATFWT